MDCDKNLEGFPFIELVKGAAAAETPSL
ncbi:unnamed protein product [Amaranthus hypochondriacus]